TNARTGREWKKLSYLRSCLGTDCNGVLPNGRDIVVKKLSEHSGQVTLEFKNEEDDDDARRYSREQGGTLKVEGRRKIQVAQKKFKKAFENDDSSSRVELIPSKIKYANKVVLNFDKEFSVFSSLSRKENDELLQDQVFKNKEEVVIKSYLIIK
nr:hypothetical protein [Tanacetum cinerariifolium]